MERCNNPSCKKELIHTEGRRPKKYCSAVCRNKISTANFLAKNKSERTKRISIEEYNEIEAIKAWNKKLSEQLEKADNKLSIAIASLSVDPNAKTITNGFIKSALKNTDAVVDDGRNNKLENAARGRGKNGINNDELRANILEQIAEIRREKIPQHRDTSIGRPSWKNDQAKKISELEKKLDAIK